MATIANANLVITPISNTGTAKCVVTAKVYFTKYEMNEMKEGLRFVLHCSLWGEDLGIGNWLDPDDFLYTYPSKYFPDANPTSPEAVTFEVVLGVGILNEDFGTDEIYGLLTLRNLYTGNAVKAKTNVVRRSF